MLKWLADENFDNTVVRGLLRRNPNIDIVRVQDVGLSGEHDPTILTWAAGKVIEDILIILECSLEGELEGQIQYLPL